MTDSGKYHWAKNDGIKDNCYTVWSSVLSDVFDEKFRIAETFLVDDKFAKDKSATPFAVRADHRVEGDSSVSVARSRRVDRGTPSM